MLKPKILTDYPVAFESFDHIEPKGTKNDNTKNGAYVRSLIRRFGSNMKYMDLGCAGGGFVSQFHSNGVFAVGIDGSDYGLKHQTGEWSNIPDYLFTANIAKPFSVVDENDQIIQFDVISAFDVLEHIYETDLPQLLNNVSNHLKKGGLFLAGIATFEDKNYHVTLKEESWWDNLLLNFGFKRTEPLEHFGRNTSIDGVYKKQ